MMNKCEQILGRVEAALEGSAWLLDRRTAEVSRLRGSLAGVTRDVALLRAVLEQIYEAAIEHHIIAGCGCSLCDAMVAAANILYNHDDFKLKGS